MRHAQYEILSDDGSFYGEIPPCRGVYANAASLGRVPGATRRSVGRVDLI
ncbi:hypothetical protein [Nitrosococcus halophilus]